MNTRLFLFSIIASVFISIPVISFASGSYGGSRYSSPSPAPVKRVDQNYEIGKAIFTGRQRGVEKLQYCVNIDGKLLPVKRSALKTFKSSSYNNLSNHLVDCAQPDAPVINKLGNDNAFYVVYYLNKRFRLGLRS